MIPFARYVFFSWLGEFDEESTRSCEDVNPWLSWASDDRMGSTEQSSDDRSLVSYREAEAVKTRLGPDRRDEIHLTARTGSDESGRVMVWFAEDVYFAFSDRVLVHLGFEIPVTDILASEPGSFHPDYAIELEPRMIDGDQYVSVTRVPRSDLLNELKRLIPAATNNNTSKQTNGQPE